MTTGETLGNLVMRISADQSQYDSDLRDAKTKAQKFDTGIKALGIGAGLFAGATAGAIALGDSFEEAERVIRTTTGAAGEELDNLLASFRKVFGENPDDPKTVAGIIGVLNSRLGLTGTELETAADHALDMARVFEVDAVPITDKLVSSMLALGEDPNDLPGFFDKVAFAAATSGTPLDEFVDVLEEYAPAMSAAGFTTDELLGFMVGARDAGADLDKTLDGFQEGTLKNAEAGIKDMGGETKTAKDAIFDWMEQVDRAVDPADALGLAVSYFGEEAGPAMHAFITGDGREAAEEFQTQMEESTGTVQEMATETETATERLETMKNRIMEALGPVGEWGTAVGATLAPIASLIAFTAIAASSSIAHSIALGISRAAVFLWGLVVAGASLLTLAWAAAVSIARAAYLRYIVTSILAIRTTARMALVWALGRARALLFAGALVIQRVAIAGMVLAMRIARLAAIAFGIALHIATGPIGLVVLAIAAAIAIGFLLWKNWDVVKAAIIKIWQAVVDAVKEAWGFIYKILFDNPLSRLIFDSWKVIPEIAKKIFLQVTKIIDSVVRGIGTALNSIIGFINRLSIRIPPIHVLGKQLFAGATIDLPNLPSFNTNFNISSLLSGIGTTVSESILGAPAAARTAISSTLSGIGQSAQNIAQNAQQSEQLREVQEFAKSLLSGITEAFNFGTGDESAISTSLSAFETDITSQAAGAEAGISGALAGISVDAGGNIIVNGDVYGFEDFADAVAEAQTLNTRTGSE